MCEVVHARKRDVGERIGSQLKTQIMFGQARKLSLRRLRGQGSFWKSLRNAIAKDQARHHVKLSSPGTGNAQARANTTITLRFCSTGYGGCLPTWCFR